LPVAGFSLTMRAAVESRSNWQPDAKRHPYGEPWLEPSARQDHRPGHQTSGSPFHGHPSWSVPSTTSNNRYLLRQPK
jgi:hypothetical protein